MPFVVKQSNSNSWFLALIVVVVAVVCHMRRPYFSFTDQPTMPQQPAVSRTEVQRANLEAAVSGSIGIDKSRGDSVSVIILDR